MENFKENIRKYGELLAKVGINVKKDDGIILYTDVNSLEVSREVVKQLYKGGAKDVIVRISDEEITLARYMDGEDHIFDICPDYERDYLDALLQDNYHRISIVSPNPDLMKDVDKDRLIRASKSSRKVTEVIYKHMDKGTLKWAVAVVPSYAWAKMVFPDLDKEEALEKLWDLVFKAIRVDTEDPVKAWEEHDRNLKAREKWLDDQHFEKLFYKGPGTDLEVYLPKEHKWVGGSSETPTGVKYMANIPTEEIFTLPHMNKVNGTLRATKPLSVNGKMVEDFEMTFKDGEIVEFKAKKNAEIFEDIMKMDEGAKRLGEVAIVPDSSPISRSNVIFNNTLFDENASCHFAIGNSYTETVINGEDKSDDEMRALGANKSHVHRDFMVGGPELDITGVTYDNKEIPILRNGEWAVDVK